MTVVGISMMRDEADIAAYTVAHMLTQVDAVIVADNLSTDNTRSQLEALGVTVVDDNEPGYHQSEKMTALARRAAELGATWIVPFDADEIWYSPFGRIADQLEQLAPQWLVAPAALYDHVPSAADPAVDNPAHRIQWRRTERAPLHKVACRWREDLVIEQGNHGARYDGGATTFDGVLVVRHFPYRSAEQFVRKARNGAAAYAATDLPDDIGAHWRQYGRILDEHGPDALADVFRRWFWSADPARDVSLLWDPAPIR